MNSQTTPADNYGTFYTGLVTAPFTVGIINWTTKEKVIEQDITAATGKEARAEYKAKLALLTDKYKHLLPVNPYDEKSPVMAVKTLHISKDSLVMDYPNFHKTGSIRGMKKLVYGKGALLVRCGNYIYNVTSCPKIYHIDAK